jgi:hypothetical protein
VSTYEHPLDNHFRAYYHAMAAQAAQQRKKKNVCGAVAGGVAETSATPLVLPDKIAGGWDPFSNLAVQVICWRGESPFISKGLGGRVVRVRLALRGGQAVGSTRRRRWVVSDAPPHATDTRTEGSRWGCEWAGMHRHGPGSPAAVKTRTGLAFNASSSTE